MEWQLRAKGDRYSKILLPFRIHTANLSRPGPCLREEEDSLLEEKDFEKKGEEKLELIEDARVFPVVAPSSHSYHCLSLESVGIDRGILSSFLFWKNLSSGIPFPRVSHVILARVGEQREREFRMRPINNDEENNFWENTKVVRFEDVLYASLM